MQLGGGGGGGGSLQYVCLHREHGMEGREESISTDENRTSF